ncbi:MAG: 3-deoxy-manno-octulosonate cytidylyltransferase [Thermodesulfovibrionia bacterium]
MPKVIAVIPARYNSTRFPGKPLSLLKGKPLIQHVYEGVRDARLIDVVYVATDDHGIYETVTSLGYNAVMTSNTHISGTDRVAEVARDVDCDIVVNVQGDEPFIRGDMVDDVVDILLNDEMASIGTLAKGITNMEEFLSPDVVKVVFDKDGFALYFSRSPIPYRRGDMGFKVQDARFKAVHGYKHIGIYGYRRDALLRLSSLEPPDIEVIEGLEQLRALFNGLRIKVRETVHDTIGIDTPEDLRRAEEWLSLSL